MAFHLNVVTPFGPYVRGQRITDPKIVEEILGSHHEDFVVRVADVAPESNEKGAE